MDNARFDHVTQVLSRHLDRRHLSRLGVAGLGVIGGVRASQVETEAKKRKKKCQAGLVTCTIKKGKRKKKLCVDAQTDPANCGGCSVTCAPGQSCQGGRCTSTCTPACPACQTCNSATGQCEADPAQVGQTCGTCLTCRADGQCAAPAPNRTVCGGSGTDAGVCCNGTCCSGCCGADGTCGACRAFATGCSSQDCTFAARNGAIGGLAGADALCQGAAGQGGLPGAYKAWLSDSTASPKTRFRCSAAGCSRRGYVRVDGQVIATDWDDLTDGTLKVPIDITQFGDDRSPGGLRDTWSHTRADGSAVEGDRHCRDWTCSFDCAEEEGDQGQSSQSGAGWTDFGSIQCTSPRRLYCFQQD